MKTISLAWITSLALFTTVEARAADLLKSLGGLLSTNTGVGALTVDEMTRGLKEALARGAKSAITNLGRTNGFLGNLDVKIPLPESLKKVESAARIAGQGQLVDDFTVSMNRAAEHAVPAGLNILADSITKMSIADAQAILQGPPDAATQYFKRTNQKALGDAFRPIVAKATDSVGVTKRYKDLTGKFGNVSAFSSFFSSKKDTNSPAGALDVDGYVTGKAVDGLFKMIAAEEKSIRANPAARTTDLLKKVFSATGK